MMPEYDEKQTWATRRTTFLLVVLLAAVVRVWVGWDADPLDLDVGHFVRYGKALANGNPSGFSHHWSLGPILLTALTHRLGLDPLFWLQLSTIIAGVVAVGACMVMVYRLCRIWSVALLAGLLMSCNPSMLVYSVNSMGEMPFIALMLLAAAIQLPPEGTTRHHPGRFLSAGALLGLGYLYRPIESYLAFGLLGLWQLHYAWTSRAFSRLLWIGLGAAVFISFSMPQTVVTKIRTGVWSPSTKFSMLVYRDFGTDSKAMYGLNTPLQEEQRRYQEMGTARYLWAQKTAIARSAVRTAGIAFRVLKDQLFDASFRIGTGWAVGLVLVGAIVLWNAPWR
ncbi:MAG: glycosyltransferase family 39 protein, partial [Verrucomicrobia bacterium]|nr:glycosyltransferase family 39 protein [Verrucomicrobiota bacterium]